MNICTIIAKNYVAHARVLAESFTANHPDGRCFALIIDEFDVADIDPANEPFTVLRPSDLDLDPADFDDMCAMYSVVELSTAVKPWLLRHMLDAHDDGSGVAYFDPDIRVVSRMVELEQALRETTIVLTPHLTKPMPRDGMKPAETDIMIAGIYNLGFIGLSAGPDADALLGWWEERLRTDCWVAPERGLFVDQKWIDWVPGLFTSITILRVPSYNIAYWNVPTRSLAKAETGYTVDGLPLRFFHFSGYSPAHRTHLSKHQNRVPLVPGTPLFELCDDYRERLLANDFERVSKLQYDHNILPSGERLDTYSRALYREGMEDGLLEGSIFTRRGETDLVAWMNQAEPGAPGLTRYLHEIWLERPDLQQAYPDVKHADRDGFLGWCRLHGRQQVPIADRMLPEVPTSESPRVSGKEAAKATTPSRGERQPKPADSHPATVARPVEAPFGVNVAGYMRSELGIGEVARQMMHAMDVASIPSTPRVLDAPNSRQGHTFTAVGGHHSPYAINLVFVNADGLPGFSDTVGEDFFRERYTIGYWWWELQDFPEIYHPSFELVDEIWVGSSFVADALAVHSPVPVVKVPVPIEITIPPPLSPGELGWPTDRFTFHFSWDYNSVYRRKNPMGVVEAYTKAFGPDDGAALVLKCINGERDSGNHDQLRSAIAGRDDIVLIDEYVQARDKNRLIATCDCYVSLHRSEGLGLTMAEAMLMGKPVIATNYSGNTDFMTQANSFLVDFTLVDVGEGAAPYDAAAQWAEPDLDHAARLMREVFDNHDAARDRATLGAATIRRDYSPAVVGQAMAQRLARIQREVPQPSVDLVRADAASDGLAQLVQRGTLPRAPSTHGKLGTVARKLLLRLLKPYTSYQLDINTALLARTERSEAAVLLTNHNRELMAELQATHAQDLSSLLAELRLQRFGIEGLTESLSQEQSHRNQELSALNRLALESAAVPYMANDALSVFHTDEAGSVFGYRDAPAGASGADQYREFEELFRGPEPFIRDRQRRYLPLIEGHGPVVDLGCGRGEFLDLLAEAGIAAVGLDSDAGMVARCRAKGHEQTVLGDAIEYLEGCEDGSLGTIFSAQVVEHLPPAVLRRLLELAPQKLKPGGLFIAETVNPHSVAALKTFWVDITHQHPLFPEAMVAFCRIAGFRSAYAFHPNGTGDVEHDRLTTGEYAVIARA